MVEEHGGDTHAVRQQLRQRLPSQVGGTYCIACPTCRLGADPEALKPWAGRLRQHREATAGPEQEPLDGEWEGSLIGEWVCRPSPSAPFPPLPASFWLHLMSSLASPTPVPKPASQRIQSGRSRTCRGGLQSA